MLNSSLVHRVARKRVQRHRSVTHICPEHYDHLLRHEPTACEHIKDLGVCFPPKNREAKRELNVVWNGTRLSNTTPSVYLGVHLDRTLCYKTHIEKTKMKVNARNSIIRKLANSKWGCKASTLRPSCLALCYSAAEYACPVWARSTHARKLNPALPDCCRIISGCLKQRTWTVYTYWPVSPLLTSGELLPAAWNAHGKQQTPDTNCFITDQLLAD